MQYTEKNTVEFYMLSSNQVCLLLLSASLLCEKNSMFVECAMKLDVSTQREVHDMVQHVLQPDNRLLGLDTTYHIVLCKTLGGCS